MYNYTKTSVFNIAVTVLNDGNQTLSTVTAILKTLIFVFKPLPTACGDCLFQLALKTLQKMMCSVLI